MSGAEFAELLARARDGAELLRGVNVPGARAWRVLPGAAPARGPLPAPRAASTGPRSPTRLWPSGDGDNA